jgi:predicted Zn-dependent peptidase
LIDEGAGDRDALHLSEAFAQMGTQVEVEVGPDACSISVTALSRFLGPALQLMSDVVMRPRLAEPDFARVRDLRLSRLRQLSRSAGTMADRMFVSEVFGDHPYGHGALGTTRTPRDHQRRRDARVLAACLRPAGTTLIIVGAVEPDEASRMASDAFGGWEGAGEPLAAGAPADATADPRIVLVDKPAHLNLSCASGTSVQRA